jgi:hypothetical protein
MPDPELLVDGGDQHGDLRTATIRNLEIEGATDVKRLEVGEPGEGHLIVGPAAGHGDRNFVFVVAIE